MELSYYEKIERHYSNGVLIIYENIDVENLYIHTITSLCPKQGNATMALNAFLNEFKKENIYIFSTSELGTSKEVLNKWYEKMGFIRVNNLIHIPYNITHLKQCNTSK